MAGEQPEGIAEAVEVDQDLRVAQAVLGQERGGAAFGSTANGSGEVKGGRGLIGAGHGPAADGPHVGFEPGDDRFELCGMGWEKAGKTTGSGPGAIGGIGGQITHDEDQVALDGLQGGGGRGIGKRGPGQAQGCIELVNRAAGFDSGMMFGHAAVVDQIRGALVAGFRDDAHVVEGR